MDEVTVCESSLLMCSDVDWYSCENFTVNIIIVSLQKKCEKPDAIQRFCF